MFVVKHLQRGVHAVAARRAGTRQGMSSNMTSPYLIPALLHYVITSQVFQLALSFITMFTQSKSFHQQTASHSPTARASKVDSRWGGM